MSSIFFIVTTFIINIFYIICYLDKRLPSHIELTVHQVAFNREIHTSFCCSWCVRFACTQISVRSKLNLKIRQVRHLNFFFFFFPSPFFLKNWPSQTNRWGDTRRVTLRTKRSCRSVFNAPTWRLGRDHRGQRAEKRTNTAHSESTQGTSSEQQTVRGASVDVWRPCVFTSIKSTIWTLIGAA